jgi:uncharacterized protein YaiE (UPF0345 family)
MSSIPPSFEQVSVTAKANVYFEGRVVSHSLRLADGSRKSLGLIFPGKYHFGTQEAERMEIVAGACEVKRDGEDQSTVYSAGQAFEVAANSGFDISVSEGICEYICSWLP